MDGSAVEPFRGVGVIRPLDEVERAAISGREPRPHEAGAERMRLGEADRDELGAASSRGPERMAQKRLEDIAVVPGDGEMRQEDLLQFGSRSRETRQPCDREYEVEERPPTRERAGIAEHARLAQPALVPKRGAADDLAALAGEDEVLGREAGSGAERSLIPNRSELEPFIFAKQEFCDRGLVCPLSRRNRHAGEGGLMPRSALEHGHMQVD